MPISGALSADLGSLAQKGLVPCRLTVIILD